MIGPMSVKREARQRGIALVVALLFLLVVTIISITAATNSSQGVRMTGNMQDAYRSFQAAEAGIYGALGLAGTADDPFGQAPVKVAPFDGMSATEHPLRNLGNDPNDPASVPVDVFVYRVSETGQCPRPRTERSGLESGSLFSCESYRITSEHDEPGRARSRVELGVLRRVSGTN